MATDPRQPGAAALRERKRETKTPKMYSVVLLNDDYTTMEFVISILEGVFQKSPAAAFRLMMQVHTQGRTACGTYTHEVAENEGRHGPRPGRAGRIPAAGQHRRRVTCSPHRWN